MILHATVGGGCLHASPKSFGEPCSFLDFLDHYLSASGNQGAIDNRIEQAMDLVKSHLMNAVRSEVEELKEKIVKLEDTISRLQSENEVLKSNVPSEILRQISAPAGVNHQGSPTTSANSEGLPIGTSSGSAQQHQQPMPPAAVSAIVQQQLQQQQQQSLVQTPTSAAASGSTTTNLGTPTGVANQTTMQQQQQPQSQAFSSVHAQQQMQ